VIKMSN